MTKQIKASLDEIVEAVMAAIFKPAKNQMGREFQLLQKHNIRTALEKFVEEKCTGERDQNGSCKDCGKKSYHMIPTERKEESVEIHHHSTASVISIEMFQHEGGSEIFKSEMWMDYSVFEKLKEAIDAKANGELSFLFLTTPKKGGEVEVRYYCQEWDKVGYICPEGQCDSCKKHEKGGDE